MELVVATHALGLGGSETYAVTLAEQLQRLGHRVALSAFELGDGASLAHAREIVDVVDLTRDGDRPCDGIVAQDGSTAFELARRHPDAPLVFVAHSEEFDEQLPPQLAGLVGAVVVLNDRVERRVRAVAANLRVVRLRQPIDVKRFVPGSVPAPVPRRLLLLGNNADGQRIELVAGVAAELGMEVVTAGAKGESSLCPEAAINGADVVMGYGRCVLEAMACGRPAYVYDHLGGDGWVTGDSYPALEADGFGGRALPTVVDRARLLADLRGYDPKMGLVNRDLAVAHHRAEHHAQEIVGLIESFGGSRVEDRDALGELARVVRAQWAAEARGAELAGRVRSLERQLHEARHAEAEVAAERHALTQTRRYRLAAALAWPLDRVRARRRGR